MNDNQHFGSYLKVLLQKYNIKHSELASALNVSRQYISSIVTNKKNPSRDCFNSILTFLDKYLNPLEGQNLANKLIYAKTGINNPLRQLVKTEITANTVTEQILLEDFRRLSSKAQIEVIRFVRQKEIENV
jgi:transcriptional regulator with XRE-family HTH domain